MLAGLLFSGSSWKEKDEGGATGRVSAPPRARMRALLLAASAFLIQRRPMRLSAIVKAAAILLMASFVPASPASAHPHVWVTVQTEVLTGPNQEITAFKHKWIFDEMYSEFAVQGLDTNGDGLYSEEELRPLAQTNVEALKEFEYFTFAFLGKDKLALKEPAPDYRLEYKNKLLTLYFTLPLATPVPRNKMKDFNFAVYDPGMYVAMTFGKKAPIKIISAKPLPCRARVGSRPPAQDASLAQLGENIDPASNLGLQFAERITIDCK
jgi:ABC-type uncharacterized transport system substrate-binding protein